MRLLSLRRLAFLSLAAFALRGFAPPGESDPPSGRADTAKPAVEEPAASPRGSTHSSAKAVPVSADRSLDLDRLERKRNDGEVYNLFSRTTRSSGPTSRRQKPVLAEESLNESTPEPRADVKAEPAPPVQPEAVPPMPPEPSTIAVAVQPPPPVPVAPPPAPVIVAAPAPPPPPPAPTAPALPFKYIGRIVEADHTVFFLTKGDKLYTVKVGDDIDGIYYVDGEIGGQLKLIYKPLSIAQTLAVGASS